MHTNYGDQLFRRQQCGIVPELLPNAAEPDHQDVEDEPESDWDLHHADAPDDEDAGQETPVLAPAAQVEIQAQAAGASEDAPGTRRCRTRRDSCTEMAAEAPVLAYCIWPIPTMSETLDSVGIVLSSHPPDLRAHESSFSPHPSKVSETLCCPVSMTCIVQCVGCCFFLQTLHVAVGVFHGRNNKNTEANF